MNSAASGRVCVMSGSRHEMTLGRLLLKNDARRISSVSGMRIAAAAPRALSRSPLSTSREHVCA